MVPGQEANSNNLGGGGGGGVYFLHNNCMLSVHTTYTFTIK